MKKYTIHFRGQKIRAKLGSPLSEGTMVDDWESAVQSDGPAAIWHITDFTFLKCGIPGAHFYHVPGVPGLFRARQPENARGLYSKRGPYLAQVDVQIILTVNGPAKYVGTLNTPPCPEEWSLPE